MWAYSFKNKMIVASLLLIVLLLVLINNFSERSQIDKLNHHLNAIHNDRLVVEHYIHQLSDNMHQIIAINHVPNLSNIDRRGKLIAISNNIKKINTKYKQTVLTDDEVVKFNAFQKLCTEIVNSGNNFRFDQSKISAQSAIDVLNQLSIIQLQEAKFLLAQSKQIFHSGKTSSEFEMAMLILITIVIQILIFSSASTKQQLQHQQPNLN